MIVTKNFVNHDKKFEKLTEVFVKRQQSISIHIYLKSIRLN